MPAPSRLEEPQCSQGSRPMRTISSSHRKHAPPPPNPRPCLPCWVTQQHQHHAIPTELGITTTTTTITTNNTSNNNTSAVFMWGVGGNTTHSAVAIESAPLDLKRDAKKRRLKARSQTQIRPPPTTPLKVQAEGGGGRCCIGFVDGGDGGGGSGGGGGVGRWRSQSEAAYAKKDFRMRAIPKRKFAPLHPHH